MEGEEEESASTSRWTCDACGCHTNQSTDRTCSICGTSNSGPSLLRRAGAGAGYAARAGWLARGLGARRGMMNEDFAGLDDEDLWESVVDGGDMGDDPESAMESLAMEVSGMASAARNARLEASRHQSLEIANRQRFLEAARAFSQANRDSTQRVDPDEVLRWATENAASYHPRWVNPTQRVGRARSGNEIEVGEGEQQNLAHLPIGGGSGRAIRTEEPLPRGDSFGSFSFSSPSNVSQDQRQRRAFGFRVAFDHPEREAGASMGGCYLIGVTTSSFTAFSEQNGLQQSPFFWGIEDSGQKYEGSRCNPAARGSRRASSSGHGIELGPQDAPLNSCDVLFGSREVVTVVCDFETRTLTFWRNDTFLGSLVTNLPRSGNLYPVAVPFNAGVTVAITGMDNDPLPLLRTFVTDWRKEQQEKDDSLRLELSSQRALLIEDGKPTARLVELLKKLFAGYYESGATQVSDSECTLSHTAAARLWYRCGMTLACLDSILGEKKPSQLPLIAFGDFLGLIEKVVEEDESTQEAAPLNDQAQGSLCEIGDKVELVSGYEKYGDSSRGPLQPGDRGTVVDLQRGPNGERRSVRVIYNGRRWWYQPQAILSERTGLIESPGAWFLRGILRAHGYDSTTLKTLCGKAVTSSSWCVGDVVVPKKVPVAAEPGIDKGSAGGCFGRIVAETSSSPSSLGSRSRDAGTVVVEYVNRDFAVATGLGAGMSSESLAVLETRKVRASKLLHANFVCETLSTPDGNGEDGAAGTTGDAMDIECPAGAWVGSSSTVSSVSDKVRSELVALSRLDRSAIESIRNECKRNPDTLASLFSAGLPDAILSAIDVAKQQMNSLEPRDDLTERFSAVGELALLVADQLFSPSQGRDKRPRAADPGDSATGVVTRSTRIRRAGTERSSSHDPRQFARDGVARREARREEERAADLQGVGASLHQRRSMLLSLMSRARRNSPGYLHEMMERGNNGELAREFAPEQLAPPFGLMQGSADFDQDEDWGGVGLRGELGENSSGAHDEGTSSVAQARSEPEGPASLLDSILRCSASKLASSNGSPKESSGASHTAFVRQLVSGGLLVDSLAWVKASVDSQTKKIQLPSLHKSSTVLRTAANEQGTPLLELAISLGCSAQIVDFLVSCGTPVGEAEIKKAAETNQSGTLFQLLKHSSLPEGLFNLDDCSPAVAQVFACAQARREELAAKMREAAGAFMVRLLRQLLELGLSSRRLVSPRVDLCSKAVSELLVGNVLLRALQRAQKRARKTANAGDVAGEEACDRSGRFPLDTSDSDTGRTAQGLLGCFPSKFLADALLSDTKYAATYLLLAEDCLSSKDLCDSAAGLTLLSTLMKRVPAFRSCSEMERYGVAELVSFHDELVSNRLAEISSRKAETEDASSSPVGSQRESRSSDAGAVVTCPKRHTAVLHVTRHSSFRCDLCGCGVERGRPMHGCRECDWDACEKCTDMAESGVVKCTAIKELASECQRLLIAEASSEDAELADNSSMEKLPGSNNSAELNSLSIRLLERDGEAVKALSSMLAVPGCVTMHQFLTVVLPSLHASLMGHTSMNESTSGLRASSGRRSKKARIIGGTRYDGDDTAYDSPEERIEFCKNVVRVMVLESQGENAMDEDTKASLLLRGPSDLENDGEDSDAFSSSENRQNETSESNDVSDGSSEILRRLQQLLSFFENVALVKSTSDHKDSPSGSQGGDLQVLTKPIEIQLYPSTLNESEVIPHPRIVVHAEPLIPIADLELHVLQNCRLNDPTYVEFCKRLARDRAVVVERAARSPTKVWQLAQVVDYDESTGLHWVRYATQWKRGQSRESLRLRPDYADEINALCYDGPETKVALAASEYFILRRSTEDKADSTERRVSPGAATRELRSNSLRDTIERQAENDFRMGEAFSFMTARQRAEIMRLDEDGSSSSFQMPVALKRTWSALSLAECMRPLELNHLPDEASATTDTGTLPGLSRWKCKLGDSDIFIVSEAKVELPPPIRILFFSDGKLPGMGVFPPETTIACALMSLRKQHYKFHELALKQSQKLFFSVSTPNEMPSIPGNSSAYVVQGFTKAHVASQPSSSTLYPDYGWSHGEDSRARKLSSSSPMSDDDENSAGLCEGLDKVCVQCMEVITLFSEVAGDCIKPISKSDEVSSGFANASMSKKLTEQLGDPVSVVGGAMPDWCTAAPSFAPRLFSYDSRRMLLERAAFGVSRSTLKQQESKINVGRLRQRMAALRGRAVELVGEAFSGGAEDPTALQLQADELYGMEEALAARVRAAFRAVKWQEYSLQVAKAAVRRESLLNDATTVMARYANGDGLSRRRLEIRFDGESGFDAASGDEAGVTRGFYADVAEALLACDNVAGVYCSTNCSYVSPTASLGKMQSMDIDESHKEAAKLPLWIPDMDSSAQVVIPTPRADTRSVLGVYPRPLPKYHPQMSDVLLRFRFMGRLFAAAMRDGFMFPLPISSAFLKLVQNAGNNRIANSAGQDASFSSHNLVLTNADLPRAGFLGGEVSAADLHVCRALNRLDAMDPPLSSAQLQKRYKEIATDQNFARIALGKSYDCSFEDYFQDRTFVDPLDPTQGEEAVPLCPDGYKKLVTIYNIREWVNLARNFILHDGVVNQAAAFSEGIKDFFPPDYLRLFTSEELQRDVCGLGDDVDNWDEGAVRKLLKLDGGKGAAEALVAVAAIGGEGGAALSRRFGPTSPTITFLVKALLEASPKQRRQFLSFVTSVPIVTPGKIEVVPMVSPNGEFLPMQDPACLPRTNTCARRMYLPKFETYESFCQVLWAVVREESKFKGFFEWRGN